MVNGFNALFADNKKLGYWKSYLAMCQIITPANGEVRNHLSKNLGAFVGLLYEIRSIRLLLPDNEQAVLLATEIAKAKKNLGETLAFLTVYELPSRDWPREGN
jgi:type II restriction enzyme